MAVAADIRAGRAYVELMLDDKTEAGLKSGAKNLNTYRQSVEGVQKSFLENLTGGLKGIRMEDRKSGENALASVLGGGAGGIADAVGGLLNIGAPMIITDFVGRSLKTGADEANRLKSELAQGNIEVQDVAYNLASQIPVFGSLLQAAASVRELFTGQKAAIEAVNREARMTTEIYDASAVSAKALQMAVIGINAQTGRYRTASANASATADPFSKELNTLDEMERERAASAQARRDAAIEPAKNTVAIAGQRKLIEDENAAMQAQMATSALYSATHTGDLRPGDEDELKKMAQNLKADKDKLAAMLKKASQDEAAQGKAFDQQEAAGDTAAADQREEIARRRAEAYKVIVVAGLRAAADAETAARVDQLREQGKLGEAEVLQIKADTENKVRAIFEAAQKSAAAIGAEGPQDPRWLTIMGTASLAAKGEIDSGTAKAGIAGSADFDHEAQKQREMEDLKAQGVLNSYDREKQMIDNKYQYELDVATEAGREKASIEARYAQERLNLETRHAHDVATASDAIEDELDRQKVENSKRGIARTLAMIELERQRRLRLEADPATTTGASIDKINELADLQRRGAMQGEMTNFGTFNGAAIDALGVGGGPVVDILKKIEENTRPDEGVDAVRPDDDGRFA